MHSNVAGSENVQSGHNSLTNSNHMAYAFLAREMAGNLMQRFLFYLDILDNRQKKEKHL
jgi:hypothetical protein